MVKISDEISDLVFEFGGAFSGEHGDGIVRGAWTKKMYGEKIYHAFQDLKKSFDPKNLMNPGKIIDTPPMDENLRFGATYKTENTETFLSFEKKEDLHKQLKCAMVRQHAKKLEVDICAHHTWQQGTK